MHATLVSCAEKFVNRLIAGVVFLIRLLAERRDSWLDIFETEAFQEKARVLSHARLLQKASKLFCFVRMLSGIFSRSRYACNRPTYVAAVAHIRGMAIRESRNASLFQEGGACPSQTPELLP